MTNAPRPGGNSRDSSSSDASGDSSRDASDELGRATELLTTHLRARGVTVNDNDSSEGLATLMDAVEAFEAAVERRGGDLMVDEPPEGQDAEPDNPDFVLPVRKTKESLNDYIERINSATASLQR